MEPKVYHNLSISKTVSALNSNIEKGLSRDEVNRRQKTFGPNKLSKEKPLSQFKIFLEQFKNPLVYILIIAGTITLFLKEFTDSIVILRQ